MQVQAISLAYFHLQQELRLLENLFEGQAVVLMPNSLSAITQKAPYFIEALLTGLKSG